ncbi:hypothetical protein [Flavobacterium sp. W21_SRS_FM6]|uniref:hypothetical protein n=1 Tax=Flavobacterium sp. W21_SRS_FM6 TaxID=3240268 RepID=UPI003F8EB88E
MKDWNSKMIPNSKNFVAVKSRYYKYEPAVAVLDHAHHLRVGFTKSPNVRVEHTSSNVGVYAKGAATPIEALNLMYCQYQKVTGKKPRSDFNCLFEHIVIFSESQYYELEKKYGHKKAKVLVLNRLKKYAQAIKKRFGFEPIAIDFHLDEGHVNDETGTFKRNIHAHVQFFNYDFSNKIAPLRKLIKKGKNKDGRTNQLNPNFEKMQDLAAEAFQDLNFTRGQSKNITNKEHLSKEHFVKQKLTALEKKSVDIGKTNETLNAEISKKREIAENLAVDVNRLQQHLNSLSKNIKQLLSLKLELQKAIKNQSMVAIKKISLKASQFLNRNVIKAEKHKKQTQTL